MRVLVDGRELEGRPSGVGRVLEGILHAWPDTGDAIEIVCRRPPARVPARPGWRVRLLPGPRWLPGTAWEQLLLPRARAGADVLLAPNYGMPARWRGPAAVCMHDCSFFALPETFPLRERWRRRWAARLAARRASFLFMGSRFAAAEARRWLGVGDDRLLVLPWGRDRRYGPVASARADELRRRLELPERFLLFVGAPLPRRDLDALQGWLGPLAARHPDMSLLLAGPTPPPPAAGPLRVRALGYVAEEDLPGLYAAATAVLYPSRYEGFGLPVLEALACGTPVVASAVPALVEIYTGRAWLVAHDDAPAWRRAVETLWTDPHERQRWAERAQRWALARDWRRSARRLRERLAACVETR